MGTAKNIKSITTQVYAETPKEERVGLQHLYNEVRETIVKINILIAAGIKQTGASLLRFKGKCVQEIECDTVSETFAIAMSGSVMRYIDAEEIEGSRICGPLDDEKINLLHRLISSLFVNGVWNGNSPILCGCDVDCRYIRQREESEIKPQRNAIRIESMIGRDDLFCGASLKPGRIGGHNSDYCRCIVRGIDYTAYRHEQIEKQLKEKPGLTPRI